MGAGRYAPSPTGDLHLGNLRTALIAWAAARSTGRNFYLRLEDLDTQRARDPQGQLTDLAQIGIDWDGEIVVQSQRRPRYQTAIDLLTQRGLVFECFCSRKDIREATSAAHVPPGAYPGTCLGLSEGEAATKREQLAQVGRAPALRLRPAVQEWSVHDVYHGDYTGPVDCPVLRRGDGAFAYNLAVVVDDIAMGVDQIVRGDDLLPSSPLHSYLSHELGGGQPIYGHVPLVLGPSGKRLAKRDGDVTLGQLSRRGTTPQAVVSLLASSLGAEGIDSADGFLEVFPTLEIPRQHWRFSGLPPLDQAAKP